MFAIVNLCKLQPCVLNILKSKIGNDQELIQSYPISHPQNILKTVFTRGNCTSFYYSAESKGYTFEVGVNAVKKRLISNLLQKITGSCLG